jgi:hypothetical protein
VQFRNVCFRRKGGGKNQFGSWRRLSILRFVEFTQGVFKERFQHQFQWQLRTMWMILPAPCNKKVVLIEPQFGNTVRTHRFCVYFFHDKMLRLVAAEKN